MIRDQIVFGTNEKKLREKLLRETELTLDSAIKICQASELARQHVLTFKEPAHRAAYQEGEAVNALSLKGKPQRKFKNNDSKIKTNDKDLFACKRCGDKHQLRQCPAYGKTCTKCKGQNHYARMCLCKTKGQAVHIVQEDTE